MGLNVVLCFLCGPPFEPLLHAASFYNLAKKMTFLLALAETERVIELHALDIIQVYFEHRVQGDGTSVPRINSQDLHHPTSFLDCGY